MFGILLKKLTNDNERLIKDTNKLPTPVKIQFYLFRFLGDFLGKPWELPENRQEEIPSVSIK